MENYIGYLIAMFIIGWLFLIIGVSSLWLWIPIAVINIAFFVLVGLGLLYQYKNMSH
jgi:CHASE2 domain-containing sensor protein